AGGKSIGLSIDLPFETSANAFLTTEIWFNYFFVRKVMFVKYASGFIVLPGGFGTLDELFEALTLIQTRKVDPFPIVMMGTTYWQGLTEWMTDRMLGEGNISPGDLKLFKVTDDTKEAVRFIKKFYAKGKSRRLR
ncbi:MAG: TIGR00730 family Rossman fold protein, partial [Bacteroidetes bacterium]|nr:TIGR00730 family Rossman fold protein [Bacteroidota bacterium]